MTFEQVVNECASNTELVANWNRLTGRKFGQSLSRKPIEVAIDNACGATGENPEDVKEFIAFVLDCIWLRLPRDEAYTA